MRMTGCLRAASRPLARRYPAHRIWSRAPGSCRIWLKPSVLLIGPKLRNRSKLSSVRLYERSRALGNIFFSVLCHSLFIHLYLCQYGRLRGPVTSGRTGSLTKIVSCNPSMALGCHLSLRAFQEEPVQRLGFYQARNSVNKSSFYLKGHRKKTIKPSPALFLKKLIKPTKK